MKDLFCADVNTTEVSMNGSLPGESKINRGDILGN